MPGKRSRLSAGGMPTSPPPRSGEVDGVLSFRGEIVGLAHAATLQEPNGGEKTSSNQTVASSQLRS